VKIINLTKGTVLADEAVVASAFFKRLKGLLGKKNLSPGEALVIKPCNSIHTFFMRFPIDALFVDKNNKIVAAALCLPPFRISKIYFTAAYVIELPAGSLKTNQISVGDLIEMR
jgi:uncharacterized protein